jgi:hypothetical protein
MSGVINKVKNALHHDKSTTHTGTAEGVAGHHDSRAANAADPRIDSDLDGSRNAGAAHNTHGTTGGLMGTAGTNTTGLTGHNTTHTGTTGSGLTGTSHATTHGTTGSGLTGGLTGTHAGNSHGSHHTGTTGGISHSSNAGPHDSNVANKVDPRVDSDLDGRGNRHGAATGGILGASGSHATAGSGTAQNTAGPHNSDLLNKVDPRVDSDRDGSKTVGGNKTHA